MAAPTDAGIDPRCTGMYSAWTSSSPSAVNRRGRAVGPLLDVGAERRPAAARPHLLGDAGEPGDHTCRAAGSTGSSVVPPAGEDEGAGAPGSARHPSGTQIVQSGSAMTPGPAGAMAGGSDGPAGRSSRPQRRGGGCPGPQATTSTGVVGRA